MSFQREGRPKRDNEARPEETNNAELEPKNRERDIQERSGRARVWVVLLLLCDGCFRSHLRRVPRSGCGCGRSGCFLNVLT